MVEYIVFLGQQLQDQLNRKSRIFRFETEDFYKNVDQIIGYYCEKTNRLVHDNELKIHQKFPHSDYCQLCGCLFNRKHYKQHLCSECAKIHKRQRLNQTYARWYSIHREDKNYRTKVKARNKSSYLYRLGKINKDKCMFCGSEENLQLHHQDYQGKYAGYMAMCLCKNCHIKIHKQKNSWGKKHAEE